MLTVRQKKASAMVLTERYIAEISELLVNERQLELVNDCKLSLEADYDSEISYNAKMEHIKSL